MNTKKNMFVFNYYYLIALHQTEEANENLNNNNNLSDIL